MQNCIQSASAVSSESVKDKRTSRHRQFKNWSLGMRNVGMSLLTRTCHVSQVISSIALWHVAQNDPTNATATIVIYAKTINATDQHTCTHTCTHAHTYQNTVCVLMVCERFWTFANPTTDTDLLGLVHTIFIIRQVPACCCLSNHILYHSSSPSTI